LPIMLKLGRDTCCGGKYKVWSAASSEILMVL